MNYVEVFTRDETLVVFQPKQMKSLEYVRKFPKRIGETESNVANDLSRLGHRVWVH